MTETRQRVPEFTKWFQDRADALMRERTREELALEFGVSLQAFNGWRNGTRPQWEHCWGIGKTVGVDPEYVRRLAGYVDPDDEPYVLEATLAPEEAFLVRAYRLAERDPDAQAHLLEAARLIERIQRLLGEGDQGEGGSNAPPGQH